MSLVSQVVGGFFGLLSGNSRNDAERIRLETERERDRIASEQEKTKMFMATLQAQNDSQIEARKESERRHLENVRSMDNSAREREQAMRAEARELRQQQAEKEWEMANANKEEREAMREEYGKRQKEKEEQIERLRQETKQEKKEAQEKYDAEQERSREEIKNLQNNLLEKEKKHSEMVIKLQQLHQAEMKALQEARLQDQKDQTVNWKCKIMKKGPYGVASTSSRYISLNIVENLLREQLDHVAGEAMRTIALTTAYVTVRDNASLAEHMNAFRSLNVHINSIHYKALADLIKAVQDDTPEAAAHAKGVLSGHDDLLHALDESIVGIIRVLNRPSTIAIDARLKQKAALDTINLSLGDYRSCTQSIYGKLSSIPHDRIMDKDVETFTTKHIKLNENINAIPLLPATDNFMEALGQAPATRETMPIRGVRCEEVERQSRVRRESARCCLAISNGTNCAITSASGSFRTANKPIAEN